MFDSAKHKLEWANQHIAKFRAAVSAYVQSNPYSLSINEHADSEFITPMLEISGNLPTEIPLILGDAAHNLRSALDHATWKLFGLDGGKQDRHTTFPTAADWDGYKGLCRGKETPRDDTKEFFLRLAAYKDGGGHEIWRLAHINNIDKHRAIAITGHGVTMPISYLLNAQGQVIDTYSGVKFAIGGGGGAGMGWQKQPGYTAKFDENSKPAIDVVFMEAGLGPFEPVIPALMHFANVVADTIGEFEKFVRERA